MNGRDVALGLVGVLALGAGLHAKRGSRAGSASARISTLRSVTTQTLDEMQRVGWYAPLEREPRHDRPSAWDINNGWCEEWAEAAKRRVGGEVVDLAALRTEVFGLPEGIFEDVAHVVLLLDGRFYDAQDLEGVDDPRQLQLVRGVSRQAFVRGSSARDPLAAVRALGYTEAEIARARAAAGQGPRALERGDQTTQTAGPTRQGAYEGIDFRPPPEVRAEALRGLRLRKQNERRGVRVDPKTGAGPGGWWIGVGRALQLVTLPEIPPRELRRMRDYFRRHAKDTTAKGFGDERTPTPGFVAWLLWGGHEGRVWARDVAGQMDQMDAEEGRSGARFDRKETGRIAKRPLGSRAHAGPEGQMALRGARLTAELAGRPRRRRGSRNASDPTAGLSEPLQRLYDSLDLTEAGKAEELAYSGPSWLLWAGLSEGGHAKLAKAYEDSEYDTEAILKTIKKKLDPAWLTDWYAQYVPQLLQQDAAEAPSFLFLEEPKVLRDVWLVHFTGDADKVARQGFRHGIDDPARIGLTTHFTEAAKTQPGYTFAFRPEDVLRYAYGHLGRLKYGKEAVVFRADAILAWHNSDNEHQAIVWGPEAKDRRAVEMNGRKPVIRNAEEEEVEYDDFPSLVADLAAGRI